MDRDEDIAIVTYLIDSYAKKLAILRSSDSGERSDQANLRRPLALASCRTTLRTLALAIASDVIAPNWESPSFAHSLRPQAGRLTGKIIGSINDYTRDQHPYALTYEQQFVREYLDGIGKFAVHAYTTSSGMAAFATILGYLQGERLSPSNKIAMGCHSYFQNKELVSALFGRKNIIWLDESEPASLDTILKKTKPAAVILDTLTNAGKSIRLDLRALYQSIASMGRPYPTLILDNTCLATACQPFRGASRLLLGGMRLVVFESLNKYHEFGMDRVTAGLVWGVGSDIGKLFTYRKNMGTIIPDASVIALPTPNRRMFDLRLRRLQRNCQYLAQELAEALGSKSSRWVRGVSSATEGSTFVLEFHKHHASLLTYKRFLHALLKRARKQSVQILAGTSFGFDHTRVYPVAPYSPEEPPFLRIAVGTEDMDTIGKIKDVLIDTCYNL